MVATADPTNPIMHVSTTERIAERLGKGALVTPTHEKRVLSICSVAEWLAPDYAEPSKYNVYDHQTGKVAVYTASNLTFLEGTALEEARANSSNLDQRIRERKRLNYHLKVRERMLSAPDRTRSLGATIFGGATSLNMSLEDLVEMLIPKYRVTHCWGCRMSLNNLEHDQCRVCGWIRCECGKCGYHCSAGQ